MSYMRITTKLLNDNVINSLFTNRSKLNDLQEQLSTGKKVSKPSDDPNASINILSAKLSLDQVERYTTNIENALSELDIADESILSTVDVVQRAKELAVQASNATNGATEFSAIKSEIDQLIEQVKDAANTKFGSKYIFGGVITEIPPYSEDADGNITYNGTPSTSNYQRKTEISENITVDTNVTGDSIFGQYVEGDTTKQTGLIGTLKNLSNDLGSSPPDYDGIKASLDDLDSDLTTLLNAQANMGGTMSRLEMTKTKMENDEITYTKFRSEAEDIDLAKTISDISYQETALQVSLKVGAKAIQSSIFDYM